MRHTYEAIKIETQNRKRYYPIAVSLEGKKVLVAGGGPVAERKIKTILTFGAEVRVVSPDITKNLQGLVRRGRIAWLKRAIRPSDLKGADIAIAATSKAPVNKKISRWAVRQKILVNVVDKPSLCSFISPAILRASKAVIAVYTHGRDPVLSRDLKNFLKENWDVFLSYRNRL